MAIPKSLPYQINIEADMRFFQTIIMESYDQLLIGSFYALPAFQKQFGFQTSDGSYQVAASWQSALSESAKCDNGSI